MKRKAGQMLNCDPRYQIKAQGRSDDRFGSFHGFIPMAISTGAGGAVETTGHRCDWWFDRFYFTYLFVLPCFIYF
ncbi:hypothetical protein CS542_05035 [Pedobacter sp. IW39]|nr:hypothetical protein CS542_05035 [Pedobacter sp. IW39]